MRKREKQSENESERGGGSKGPKRDPTINMTIGTWFDPRGDLYD